MTFLIRYVDELEHAIDIRGVQAVDPREIALLRVLNSPHLSRSLIVVEMLRVWMEHSWSAGTAYQHGGLHQVFRTSHFRLVTLLN